MGHFLKGEIQNIAEEEDRQQFTHNSNWFFFLFLLIYNFVIKK